MTRSPDHDSQSPTNPRGQTGWIGVISGSMFSGKTDIYEARCRRNFEPLSAEKCNRVKESRCD